MAVYCGTPIAVCCGMRVTLNAAWNPDGRENHKSGKLHTDREGAFKCYGRYLLGQGYKRVGQREYESPNGPILLLDKVSKFGAAFRKGKLGEKGGSRFTPVRGRGAIVEKIAVT